MYKRLGDTVLEKMGSGSTERRKQGLLQGLAFFNGVVKSPIYCVVVFFQTLGILHV